MLEGKATFDPEVNAGYMDFAEGKRHRRSTEHYATVNVDRLSDGTLAGVEVLIDPIAPEQRTRTASTDRWFFAINSQEGEANDGES